MSRRRNKRRVRSIFPFRGFLPQAIRPWVFGLLMLFAAFFVLFSFFDLSGAAGRGFMKAFEFLMGRAIFVLPLIFILGGLSFFSSKEKKRATVVLAMVFTAIGLCGILGAIDLNRLPEPMFKFLYSGRGGWLGNIAAWPLMKIFGFWVGQIAFVILIAIGGLIFWYLLYSPRAQKEKDKAGEKIFKEESALKKPFFRQVFAPKFKVSSIEGKKESQKSKKEKETKFGEPELIEFEPKIKPLEGVAFLETSWNFPPLDLLAQDKGSPQAGDVQANAEIIKKTLENFDIPVEMADINIGPTVTQYTLKPAEGVKLSKITTLNNNLALALAAHPLRIEAPIPGRSLVGIEVPNKIRTLVRLRNLFAVPEFQNTSSTLTFALGRDVVGEPVYADLAKMPHLLVAGSTGSGKTICLSSVILSLLFRNSPTQLRLVLIDPKRVEFSNYKGLPHLICPVIFDVQKTLVALKWLIEEMEKRFDILSRVGVRNIDEYNQKVQKESTGAKSERGTMPYLVLIIDELADLMAAKGREIEAGVVKLAQKARAVGVHLILATQRPSVEVITGLIKANITSRVAFQVASQVDSRTILDCAGSEKLLGSGDLLFTTAEISRPKRIQGAYVSSKEIEAAVNFILKRNKPIEETADSLTESLESEMERVKILGEGAAGEEWESDPVFEEAKRLVLETKKASASFLQRKLRIGYARAARLLDMLEGKGIVGPADGAKPREVFFDEEALLGEKEAVQELKDDEEDENEGEEYERDNGQIDESN